MRFQDFGIDPRLISSINHLGFDQATEVQEAAIPLILGGCDIMATSQTGSGKTIAYGLPLLQRMLKQRRFDNRNVRALILAPTRELAIQVHANIKHLAMSLDYQIQLIIGRESFQHQEKLLRKNPEILIATPGRLLDHLRGKTISIEALEFLILDEADRMLDMGFREDVSAISAKAPHVKRQTLLFSATLEHVDVANICNQVLRAPERVEINRSNDQHEKIEQRLYFSDNLTHKEEQLVHLVESEDFRQLLIFTATKSDTERLAQLLVSKGVNATSINGDMLQNQRKRTLDDFRRGRVDVLVATDVAARGLDIRTLSHVINFDLPINPEDFIHRTGRTGRAGATGIAISLVSPKDWTSFCKIQSYLKVKLPCIALEGFEAKFKGLKPKPVKKLLASNKGRATKLVRKGDKKAPEQKQNTAPKQDKKQSMRDSMAKAVDGGFTPMKRKPRAEIIDNDHEED
ncbi:MAG: superfamily II DNA/RNA helicase [Moritella sp.]